MKSLRNRISIAYALLVMWIIAALAAIFVTALSKALFDQARVEVLTTLARLAYFARTNPSRVLHGHIVEHLSSQRIWIEIDDAEHNDYRPLIRSEELGKRRIPRFLIPANDGAVLLHEGRYDTIGHVLIARKVAQLPHHLVILRVAQPLKWYDSALDEAHLFLGVVVLIALPLGTIAAFWISTELLEPIARLVTTMRSIGTAKLGTRVRSTRLDEFGELARTLDAMLDRLEESFERERRFIADASHELKTPLTVIQANAEMLRRWAQSDEAIRTESIAIIIKESENLTRLIDALLTLAQCESNAGLGGEIFDLRTVIVESIDLVRSTAESKGLSLRFIDAEPDASATLFGNAMLLRRVFDNVLDNAVKFTSVGGVTVELQRRGRELIVTTTDTGIGLPAGETQHIFERLYRGDASRSRRIAGFGLGLSLARSFIELHHGRIDARPALLGGTTIEVRLPREPRRVVDRLEPIIL